MPVFVECPYCHMGQDIVLRKKGGDCQVMTCENCEKDYVAKVSATARKIEGEEEN